MSATAKLTEDQKSTLRLIIDMSNQIRNQCSQVMSGSIQDPHLIVSTVDVLAGQIRDLTKSV